MTTENEIIIQIHVAGERNIDVHILCFTVGKERKPYFIFYYVKST